MNELLPRRFQPVVIGSLVIATVILVLGNFDVDEGEEGGTVGFIVAIALIVAAVVLLLRFLVQPALAGRRPAARDALIVGVIAVLFVVVYWTGLPWALGAIAVVLATIGRESPARRDQATAGPDPAADVVPADRKTATAALALGWIAILAATVVGLLDTLG